MLRHKNFFYGLDYFNSDRDFFKVALYNAKTGKGGKTISVSRDAIQTSRAAEFPYFE